MCEETREVIVDEEREMGHLKEIPIVKKRVSRHRFILTRALRHGDQAIRRWGSLESGVAGKGEGGRERGGAQSRQQWTRWAM